MTEFIIEHGLKNDRLITIENVGLRCKIQTMLKPKKNLQSVIKIAILKLKQWPLQL